MISSVLVWSGLPTTAVEVADVDVARAAEPVQAAGPKANASLAQTDEEIDAEVEDGNEGPPPERVKELKSRRTANTKVFQLSDGRFEAELSADPVHFRDAEGDWKEIDTTVTDASREGYTYGNKKNGFHSSFGTRSDRLIRLDVGKRFLTMGIDGDRRDLEPDVSEDVVTYPDAFGDADLVYQVTPVGVKEEIVLDEPPEQTEFTFTMRMGGVVAREQEDGSIGFFRRSGGGSPVFEIPKPFMYDDADDASSPYGKAWSDEVTQSVTQDGSRIDITLTADEEWLADPDRTYPVVIDPTIIIEPTPTQGQDAMIRSAASSTNYGESWQLGVGTDSSGVARSLLRFDVSWLDPGTQIDSAELRVWYDQGYHTNEYDVPIEARRVTAPWDESTVTWSNFSGGDGAQAFTRETVDNGDEGKTSFTGTWPYSTNSNLTQHAVNGDYQYDGADGTSETYTWIPDVPADGVYEAEAHYVQAGDRTTVPYTVHHADGQDTVPIDQASGTQGVWASLGEYPFDAGTSHKIDLTEVNESGKSVIADAVRLTAWAEQTKEQYVNSVWHGFPVRDLVQQWVDGVHENYGFMLRAADESVSGRGGAYYEAAEYAYNGGTANRPKLVLTYGKPGVVLDPITTFYATGAELSWPEYSGDDIVEYQVHRSIFQRFTPSAATLVAPLPTGTTSFTDTTAEPTPADDPEPFGNAYYYMIAVKTDDGDVVPGNSQLARLPKVGNVSKILQGNAVDTTLSSGDSNTNHDEFDGEPWLGAGDNGGSYGKTRTLVKFPDLNDEVPAGATITDADLRLWKPLTFGSGAQFDLHALTTEFDENTATWNEAKAWNQWSTPGGDYDPTVVDSVPTMTTDSKWHQWYIDDLVQQWVDDASSNHGALIKIADESAKNQLSVFASNELATEPRLRPQLRIKYTEPTAESTYYAPATSVRAEVGEERTVDVTVTNTTSETWTVADYVLSYHWLTPDGTDITTTDNRTETELPRDLAPGETATVSATVISPTLRDPSNKREEFTLQWDMRNRASGQWMSDLRNIPGLDQSAIVEDVTSNQLGLEKFYQYTGVGTGAGSTVLNNLYAGNTVFSYDALANPSRGVSTFVRMTYNSLDTSASSMGFGWTLATSSLMRMGTPLDFHPRGQDWPAQITLTDGDGTAHLFRLNKHDSSNEEDWDYDSPHGVNLYLQKTGSSDPTRAWVFTAPDRTEFYFDEDGYQSALADNNGNELLFTYESRKSKNKPIKFLRYLTDPTGRQTLTIDYYTKGQDYTYVDDTGAAQSDSNLTNPKIIDQVESITDISGRRIEFVYTEQGLLAEMTDGVGEDEAKTFGFSYDATQGNKNVKLVEVTDPRGNSTALTYFESTQDPKAKWMLESLTDRAGGTTQFAYVDPDGPQGGTIETTVTDAKSNATVYLMDGFGRPTSTTNAKGESTTLTWDDNHNVTELVEDNGATTSWTYDPKTGYPTSITDAEANANGTAGTTLDYETSLSGYVADLVGKVSPEGRAWEFGYDSAGNLSSVIDPAGTATDELGDYMTTYTYDSYGQLETETDANGNTTTYSDYHPAGYPKTITDALDNPTSMTYDKRGNVLTVTNANGVTSTYGYDLFGRPLESSQPKDEDTGDLIVTPAPVYDPNDNVLESTAPNGAVSTYEYDPVDRMIASTAPVDEAGDPERRTTYAYDAVGNITEVVEPNGNLADAAEGEFTTTYGYDEIYQLTSVTNAEDHVITYEYDNVGNVVTVVDPRKNASADPDDYTSTYTYDLAHRTTAVTDASGETETTEYDLDGLVTQVTDKQGGYKKLNYDPRGLVTSVTVLRDLSGFLRTENTTAYEYDEVGNRTRVRTPRNTRLLFESDAFVYEWVYDELNRVVEQVHPYDPNHSVFNAPVSTTYSYDAVGNLTQVSAPPSNGHSARNTTDYTHYDNGWIKTSTDPWHIATSYDYNELGQQTARTLTSGGGSSSRTMSWSYYPDGKLAGRSDDGVPVGQNEIVVDNTDYQNTEMEPTWNGASGISGYIGPGYRWVEPGDGSSTFTWRLNVPADGDYEVFVNYVSTSSRATDAPYAVTHDGGEDTVRVNQQSGGGEWQSLGSYAFSEDGDHSIVLSDDADGRVVADAVKLVRDNSADTDAEAKDLAYSYDANGNLVEVTDASSDAEVDAYKIAYTGLNQVSKVEEFSGTSVVNTTGFSYDANGNPLTRTHDDTFAEYAYDLRDLVEQVTNADAPGDADAKVTEFTYTANGWPATETKPNQNVVTSEYFDDGLLRHQVETKPDGTVVAEHRLSYDANGNLIRDVASTMDADNPGLSSDRTYRYTYDPRDRISQVTKT
ncbi:golvesin C-terminal-like domain-containing protein, partial [Phytoactinopolyspora halotolerans]